MADLERAILAAINEHGALADTGPFAEAHGVEHAALVGVMKSLIAAEMVEAEARPSRPGRECSVQGSPCLPNPANAGALAFSVARWSPCVGARAQSSAGCT